MPKREPMTCPHCGYVFTPRVEKPKRCPLCQRWINKPGGPAQAGA
jgi:predicted Zn-ribbon and HTH transcriptional regulator